MPNDVKAILSLATLLFAVGFAFWERSQGRADLFWLVVVQWRKPFHRNRRSR